MFDVVDTVALEESVVLEESGDAASVKSCPKDEEKSTTQPITRFKKLMILHGTPHLSRQGYGTTLGIIKELVLMILFRISTTTIYSVDSSHRNPGLHYRQH